MGTTGGGSSEILEVGDDVGDAGPPLRAHEAPVLVLLELASQEALVDPVEGDLAEDGLLVDASQLHLEFVDPLRLGLVVG